MPEDPHAQAPTEIAGCDCHEGIPRDSAGVPTYFILPPADRAKYGERMSDLKQAWDATRDPAYFREAFTWSFLYRQPTPRWLYEAGDAIAAGRRTKQHDEQYLDGQRHLVRYETVRAFREAGCSEDEALDKAVEDLARRGQAASRYTVKDSYDRIWRELQGGRFGRYQPLVQPRFRTKEGRPVIGNPPAIKGGPAE
jgi:hypothetical protein